MIATISEMYTRSFYHALKDMQNGQSWVSEDLNALQNAGRIVIRPLSKDDDTSRSITIPVTWTIGDEAKNSEEYQKINLVSNLIKNTIHSAEDLILEQLDRYPTERFIVSDSVRYYLTPVEMVPGQPAFYCLCCFAVAGEEMEG